MLFNSYYLGLYAMMPVILISLFIQFRLKSTYAKYSQIQNSRRVTGAQMAEMILRNAGIHDVSIVCINGSLSDHYNPLKKVVSLSADVYNGTSVASIGIAAHECGHAIQHQVGYFPIKLRNAVVGITNFSSKLLYVLVVLSFFLSGPMSIALFNVAILCYTVLFIFQLITLPVEFNASARAVDQIRNSGYDSADINGVKRVLSAAAMTYVAAAITALWQLLIMINRRRNR